MPFATERNLRGQYTEISRALRDAQVQALEALVNRRRQLVEMLTPEKNRRTNSPKVIHKSIDEHIRWLEKRLSGLESGAYRELESLGRLVSNFYLFQGRPEHSELHLTPKLLVSRVFLD